MRCRRFFIQKWTDGLNNWPNNGLTEPSTLLKSSFLDLKFGLLAVNAALDQQVCCTLTCLELSKITNTNFYIYSHFSGVKVKNLRFFLHTNGSFLSSLLSTSFLRTPKKNQLCKGFMRKETRSRCLVDLSDSHIASWWATLSVNRKETPAASFSPRSTWCIRDLLSSSRPFSERHVEWKHNMYPIHKLRVNSRGQRNDVQRFPCI